MTVRFRRPKTGPDWRKLAAGLLPAAPSGASYAAALLTPAAPLAIGAAGIGFAVAAEKAIRDASEAAEPQRSIDERAWIWLRVSLAAALFDLIGGRDLAAPLDSAERKDAVRAFLAEALDLDGTEELDPAILTNPAAAPILSPLLDRLPALIRAVAPEHSLTDARIRADFAACLRAASARVHALDTAYYGPLADAVTGPFAEGLRRDLAWSRHEDWIRGLFRREPIFAPDVEEPIPLEAVYHRLRCFWHVDGPQEARGLLPPVNVHVADLHQTLHDWLRAPGGDNLRVVAGGPGSGKSAFSKAFAVEVIAAAEHRVIYIPLQYLRLSGDLATRLGEFLRGQWHATDPRGGAGFESSPLGWRAYDTLPYLLIFDGLDELSHDESVSDELSRKFIASVHSTLAKMNNSGPTIRAVILGRSAACQIGLREVELASETLINVAPMKPLAADGRPDGTLGYVRDMVDPQGLAPLDTRPHFWKRAAAARGQATDEVPEAVTSETLIDFSAEPLLLHLLMVSGYIGPNWQDAARNRNLVYREIFRRIFERNKSKDHPSTRNLGEKDFFTLLECLGLAAWRGNGRTGSAADFATLRDLHATGEQRKRFGALQSADLRSVAIQVHSRLESSGEGFAFIHKSFGEYLAARGLLSAGLRAVDRMTVGDDPWREEQVAESWSELVGQAELTYEILGFLDFEAQLLPEAEAVAAIPPLTRFLDWTLRNGMPIRNLAPGSTYRDLEKRQRCAEADLLFVLESLVRSLQMSAIRNNAPPEWLDDELDFFDLFLDRRFVDLVGRVLRSFTPLAFEWEDRSAAHRLLARHEATGSPLKSGFRSLPLKNSDLTHANLSDVNLFMATVSKASLENANLFGAYSACAGLSEADLVRANLTNANLAFADLTRANLVGAMLMRANLVGADLRGASLTGAMFDQANLSGAIFDSDLRGCRFYLNVARAADFRNADFDPSMLASIFGVRAGIGLTLLPEGVEAPAHWHVAADADEDSAEARRAYRDAYDAWRTAEIGLTD